MKTRIWALAAVGGVLWLTAAAGAVTVVLNPVADGHAGFSAYDGLGNGASAVIMTGRSYVDGSGTRVNRAINIRFDLSGIDPGSDVLSATVRLFEVSGDTGQEIRLEQLVSGTMYTDGDFGSSYNINEIASTANPPVVLAASTGRTLNAYNEWGGAAVTAEVKRWLGAPGANYGFRVENTAWQGETGAYFSSREGELDWMPELVLEIQGAAGAHPGDANRDGLVNLEDFGMLKDNFGATTGATWEMGDFNGDGGINLEDFGIMKDHFGHTSGDNPVVAVPEPASVALVLVSLAGLRRRR